MTDTDVVDAEVVESTELATQEHGLSVLPGESPKARLQQAQEIAEALAPVVRDMGAIANIKGKEHVQVEGWQTLGSMLGVFGVIVHTERITDDKGMAGWESICEARTRAGDVVGRSEAQCSRSESRWDNADDYAIRSMAQTRSISKALSGPLRFVMKLAGFAATPAEEMDGQDKDDRPRLICPACKQRQVVHIKSNNEKAPKWKCENEKCDGGTGGRSWASWEDKPPEQPTQEQQDTDDRRARILKLVEHYGPKVIEHGNFMRNSEKWNNPGEFKFAEQIATAPEEFIAELESHFKSEQGSTSSGNAGKPSGTTPAQSAEGGDGADAKRERGVSESTVPSSSQQASQGSEGPTTGASATPTEGVQPSDPAHPCPNCGTECIETPASQTKWACPTGDWESYHVEPWKEGGEVEKLLRVKSYTPDQKKLYDTMHDFSAADAIKAVNGIEDRAQLQRVNLAESDGRNRKTVLVAIDKRLESEAVTGGSDW